MDKARIRQVSKLSGISEELVRAVFTAELLRATKEFVSNGNQWAVTIYGELIPIDKTEMDVCQTKLIDEFLDMIDGKFNQDIIEDLR